MEETCLEERGEAGSSPAGPPGGSVVISGAHPSSLACLPRLGRDSNYRGYMVEYIWTGLAVVYVFSHVVSVLCARETCKETVAMLKEQRKQMATMGANF